MKKELLTMRKELAAILRGNSALRQALWEVNKMDMIKASFITRVSRHQDLQVDRILEGQLIKEVALGDYVFIENYSKLIKVAYSNLEMGNSVDVNMLKTAYRILVEDDDEGFRKSNPVVYSLNHVPPHRGEIQERLEESLRKVYSKDFGGDVIARAMYMHNTILDIWPFEEYNIEIAVFAMNYFLLQNGFMPIDMPMDKNDYMELVTACLKGIRPDEEYRFMWDAVFEKMKKTLDAAYGIA